MPTEKELKAQLSKLGAELDKRAKRHANVAQYDDGGCPIPQAVIKARLTKAYKILMSMASAPWGSLVIDSVQDRLQVTGIRSGDDAVDDRLWGVWQDNAMDAESKLAHRSALLSGRAYGLVWTDDNDENPEISLDDDTQMIVQYREGSRRRRVAALRRFVDDDAVPYATLYRREGIYKFQGPKNSSGQAGTQWERREVDGENWPLENPLDLVPVVEIPVNQRLAPGSFGYARGEYQHCTGLIDRINLLTFLGLVVALWMGFPLRAVIGGKIIRDDLGNPVAPFDVDADKLVQLEDPKIRLEQFEAADRKNLSVFAELDQLAVITKTPRHYFPLEQGMSNLSAEAIRASEGGLHAKVPGHKDSLGEAWEEILRISGLCLKDEVELSSRAELQWAPHEFRSLAERADAASKLKDVLPPEMIAEYALAFTDEQISRMGSSSAGNVLRTLIEETAKGGNGTKPKPEPEPAPTA